ncbi:VOC family protein [Flavihumibacter sp. CACIAM 22H1]|uniref:VOC family protein n=1 Tax=Flavihumibacter sp. CACIAM 22H1 TaxID=1812911 RepID=UPI000AD49FB5|nr:VOC family protein [Flavihumibacter sp. CACIAM 22H1]
MIPNNTSPAACRYLILIALSGLLCLNGQSQTAQPGKTTRGGKSPKTTAKHSSKTNPSMQIRINHIALYVSNLHTSTAFYQEVIGLDTIPEPFHDGRHTWFSISENAHLHLISGRATPPEPEKNTHLCFSTGKMDELLEKLKAKGIHYEDWQGKAFTVTKRVDGIRQIYLKDPDGYWIEINDDF